MSEERYVRGAFAVFRPRGKNIGTTSKLIPFRFNPEQLSRSLQIEQAQQQQGTDGAQTRRGGANTEQASDALDGPLKHTFSVLIRLDLRDRESARADLTTEDEVLQLGVLPEIAALEELMYPAETPPSEEARNANASVAPKPPRSVVLLVWGIHRVFPVRVVSMTINETLHNAELAPIRAEIEVALEVARDASTGHPATVDAIGHMAAQRRKHAMRFYESVAMQGTNTVNVANAGDFASQNFRDK